MLFNSLQFLIFFPIVLLIYFIIPQKQRYIWLLAASYYFYMCWNVKYVVLLILTTTITYIGGRLIEYVNNKQIDVEKRMAIKKAILIAGIFLTLSILFFFKYINFALANWNRILNSVHINLNIPAVDIILPIGISFYTFQAVGYLIDVYRGDIYAEKNFLRYALFVSFFPQLVAGPIERSGNLLKQLGTPVRFNFDNFREGILLMLWGFFLKIVLADRIAIFVNMVYGDYITYPGYYLLIATILFAIQIYCDFYGYSVIAVGSAKILGINLMDNFKTPYFAQSTSEFWKRWHISLSSWFKDYLYIPLGGSRKGTARKYLNLLIVFLVSGLWHGARWSFVIWGGLNGIYQIIGKILQPIKERFVYFFKLNKNSFGHKFVCMIFTFFCIDFSWIFFRATGFKEAFRIIKSILIEHNPWILLDGSIYTCGLDSKNFGIMIISIIILEIVDICNYNKIQVRKVIMKQDYWCRWIVIAISICFILLFGIWGSAYNESNFIYFQF